MVKRTRRKHSADFKAKVAMAAIVGDKALAELAQQFKVHPHQITEWKRQLSERAAEVISRSERIEPPLDLKVLHAKIGQLTLEACHAVDVLQEAFTHHGTPEIVNTDQVSQFTAQEFVQAVKEQGCKIRMDGRVAWRERAACPWGTIYLLNDYGKPSNTKEYIYMLMIQQLMREAQSWSISPGIIAFGHIRVLGRELLMKHMLQCYRVLK